MDALERILGPARGGAARDLLARVDGALISGGAPAEHPIWPLLRRAGALPGEAAEWVAALRPEVLDSSAAELHTLAEEYSRRHGAVGESPEWTGAAADAFGARWAQLGAYLGATTAPRESSLAGRMAATAAYLDDLAAWARSARDTLAGELATVLGSAEAVRLRAAAPPGEGLPSGDVRAAAAAIGVRILGVAADAYDAGVRLPERWGADLGELTYHPVVETGVPGRGTATTVTF
jgi:hypothetical protein